MREALGYLNAQFTEDFWSVERLIKFSEAPYSEILQFVETEKQIVREVYEIGNYKEDGKHE